MKSSFRVAILSLFLLGFAKCSSGPKAAFKPGEPKVLGERLELGVRWEKELPGNLMDLGTAGAGNGWVAAIQPDSGRGSLIRVSEEGEILWTLPMPKRVRTLAISMDGKSVAYAIYEGELTLLGEHGRRTWVAKAHCTPRFVALKDALVCWHDDDTENGVGFELRSLKDGRKLGDYKLEKDLLAFEISPDLKFAALAIEGGEARILRFSDSQTIDTLRTWRVGKEIASISVENDPKDNFPSVAMLVNSGMREQEMRVYGDQDSPLYTHALRERSETILFHPPSVLVHGNNDQGQLLEVLKSSREGASQNGPKEWRVKYERRADYAPWASWKDSLIFAGFEDRGNGSRLSVWDPQGIRLADFPLPRVGGSYLYSVKNTGVSEYDLLFALDNGKLTLYHLRAK